MANQTIGINTDVDFTDISFQLNPTVSNVPEYQSHLYDEKNNHNDLYIIPDVRHLSLFGTVLSNVFTFESNTIKSGNGENIIQGTMVGLHLQTNADTDGMIGSNLFTFESNTIDGGQSAPNRIFGTMDIMTLTAADGVFNVIGTIESSPNNTFDFAGNELNIGNADENFVTGSFITLVLQAEDFGVIGGTHGNGGNIFDFGGNSLIAGNGDNNNMNGTAFGVGLNAENRGVIGSFSVADPDLTTNDFVFHSNTLDIGNGNGGDVDGGILVGSVAQFRISATNFGSIAFEGRNVFDFESNIFNVGNCDDLRITGQVQGFSLFADSGGMFGSTFNEDFGGYEGKNSFLFRGNDISSGHGSNVIVTGNIDFLEITTTNASLHANTLINFGDNTLHADGDNATLVGNFQSIAFDIDDDSLFQDNAIDFGNNTLIAGNYTATLYGSFFDGSGLAEFATQTPELSLNGTLEYTVYDVPLDTYTTLPFDLTTFEPLAGVEVMDGGTGTTTLTQNVTDLALPILRSDQIDGTHPFAMKLSGEINIAQAGDYTFYTLSDDNSGLFIDGDQVILANTFQAGTYLTGTINLSQGTHSIDVLYLENLLQYTLSFGLAGQDDNQVLLGNNTLVAGQGDAEMWGYGPGDLQFGDNPNILYGQNTFQFDLSKGGFGDITIRDMNVGNLANASNDSDILEFIGENTVTDVDNLIDSYDTDGQGGTLVTFKGGLGTIDFANISFNTQDSIADFTPNVVVHP